MSIDLREKKGDKTIMLYAKELLEKFVSKHQTLFKLHDLNINTDNIEDGEPQNAFAYIYLKKITNKKTKPLPFKKGIDIELWSYAAANNGNPCFSLAIEISNKDSCYIPQRMVDLIIPYDQKKWDDKNKWNEKDYVQIKPEHFHQLILEPAGVDFDFLKHDESQEILPTNQERIKGHLVENHNKKSEYYYSFFFNEYDAEKAFDEFFNDILPNFIKNDLNDTERLAEIQARRGQGKYRRLLMNYWGNKCAVTDCDILETLRASHAMPWAECTSANQRINKYNGFLLNANLDALFDKGLITFDDNGVIKISKTITKENRTALGVADDMHLRKIDKEHLEFLHYHQENIWKDRRK